MSCIMHCLDVTNWTNFLFQWTARCPNRVLLFVLRTSFFDLLLNVLIALGFALLVFFRTGVSLTALATQTVRTTKFLNSIAE